MSWALALLLAAAPVTEKPKLAVLELTPGAGVESNVSQPLTEALTAEITARGFFEVISQRDIQTLLGVERQKQLLGCSEQSASCLAELSGALGARFVLSGSIAKLGDAYQLSLTTLDTTRAQPLGRSTRLAKDLNALQTALPWAVAEATATPLPPPPSRWLPYTLMGTGTAAMAFGLVWGVLAFNAQGQLSGELTAERPGVLDTKARYEERQNAIDTNKVIGGVALLVGAGLVVTGVLLNPADVGPTRVALVPTGNGVGLVCWW